jgi:uncharacterized membrane protein
MARAKTEIKVEKPVEIQSGPSTEEKKAEFKRKVKKAGKIICGVLVALFGLFLIWLFWPEFISAFKGLIGVFVVLIGLLVLLIGWTD